MADRNVEEDAAHRRYAKPYGSRHPIPTIQGYKEHQKELEDRYGNAGSAQEGSQDESKAKKAFASAKSILKGEDEDNTQNGIYPVSNHNDQTRERRLEEDNTDLNRQPSSNDHDSGHKKSKSPDKSATEQATGSIDPRDKRKAMKKAPRKGGRTVTDPVTHLPITIYDKTSHDLDNTPENNAPPGYVPHTATGFAGASKEESQLGQEQREFQSKYHGLQGTFPPPSFEGLQQDLSSIYRFAIVAGLSSMTGIAVIGIVTSLLLYSSSMSSSTKTASAILAAISFVGASGLVVYVISGWIQNKTKGIWDDRTWEALREQEKEHVEDETELPESVQWLNSLLTSVWPLINPDLFSSLIDMLEDVMQASLPKVVRMVSIDDMGQGSESIRILGINWLPTGAAAQAVGEDGGLKSPGQDSDRVGSGQGQQDQSVEKGDDDSKSESNASDEEKKQQQQAMEAMRAGMEAEEGDFVNLELAFAYRARTSGKSIQSKAKNAHLYLKFYLPGGIVVPVWVELRGIVGIMRLRLQLTPDPPFFSICTFTFLGQPQADLSCVPLSKHSLNVMDVPLISSFVQSSIDAALAEYVAPKSMTLNLKDMLMGEDFKKDTTTRGVVWIFIQKARDFKQGDGGIGPIQGASDSYVSVSWSKFGKPVASTRVIENDQSPIWHEWANILVSSDEINATEKLKLQLWDSDKWTADDDLGRTEVDLRELMQNPDTKNRMCDREDRFTGADVDEKMPGTLNWSVGYFEKTRITDAQLQSQTFNTEIRTKEQMKQHVEKTARSKLREARLDGKHEDELHQQQVQDFKELEDNMIISAPPSSEHLSGILSVHIHNITGLEVQSLQKRDKGDQDFEDEDDTSAELPDSYCTIILNHRKVYRTRTKPKNAKPFFNAGTERFVRNWTTTEVIVSVRDSREKEDDALLGVVYLPLNKLFKHRSQVMDTFPLAGGVGYGRARISMVWRSVELQLSQNLRGWDYGTLEIKKGIKAKGPLKGSLDHDRLKIHTNLGKTKFEPKNGEWLPKHHDMDEGVFLAVKSRYSSPLVIEFRKSSFGPDKTPAFGVLWLSELVDDEEQTVSIKVWKGDKSALTRAQTCCEFEGTEENSEPIGELELTLRFWRGLSGYHKKHAMRSKNNDLRNVMECLDTINDENMDEVYEDESDSSDNESSTSESNGQRQDRGRGSNASEDEEEERVRRKLQPHTNTETSTDSSDQESNDQGALSKIKAPVSKVKGLVSSGTDFATGDQQIDGDGSRGLRAQVQDYKQHHKQLHRKHRGIMQWKTVRTLDWTAGKAKRAGSRITDLFEHSEKGQGIETEV